MSRVKQILLDQFKNYKLFLYDNLDDLKKHFIKTNIILEVWCWNWKFFQKIVLDNQDKLCIWCDLKKDRKFDK